MLKLIHGADFHLDSPFSGLSPQKAAQRRGEQRQLLEDLARAARERQADLVLLSGDLFDSAQIYRETAQALCRGLSAIPCPVFIAPGNHDCYDSRSPYDGLEWPDNVHIFTADRVEGVTLPELNCTVWGRAFVQPHCDRSPLAGFHAPREDGRIHLMTLHADLSAPSDYGPITQEEISSSGLDYLALGHIHRCSGIRQAGSTFWAYPGCPEGRGFDETGEKGVLYVEVEPGRVRGELLPLARHRYTLLSVEVTGQEPLAAIRAALPPSAPQDIFSIRLTGESQPIDIPRLEEALAGQVYGLSLQDHTRLPQNLWERREEDSLTGLFLKLMWARCQAEPENRTLQQAAQFGLAALEHGEDPYL